MPKLTVSFQSFPSQQTLSSWTSSMVLELPSISRANGDWRSQIEEQVVTSAFSAGQQLFYPLQLEFKYTVRGQEIITCNRHWWDRVWGRSNLPEKSSTGVLCEPKFGSAPGLTTWNSWTKPKSHELMHAQSCPETSAYFIAIFHISNYLGSQWSNWLISQLRGWKTPLLCQNVTN